jgi:hypothetical protein
MQFFLYMYNTHRVPLLISSLLPLGRGPPLWCRVEILGPAVQQADLQSEPRRTLTTPHPLRNCNYNLGEKLLTY